MNLYKKASLAVAAVAMTATPVVASAAQSASQLSVASYAAARADADTAGQNEMGGRGWLLGVLAALAFIGAIVIAADGSDDSPTSP